MTELEIKRKELDRLIAATGFALSDSAVIEKALEFESYAKKYGLG